MKTALKVVATFLIVCGASGCGDTSDVLIHDVLVFWNEVCDNLLRVTDDEKADQLLKAQFKILGFRQEKLMDRLNKYTGNIDKLQAQELDDAFVDYFDEIQALEKRLEHCEGRVREILKNATGDTTNIKMVLEWVEEKKKFKDVNLGDYTPNPERFQKPPKQFEKSAKGGLLPRRPQLDRTPKLKNG